MADESEADDGAVHEYYGLSPRAQVAFRKLIGRPPTDDDLERIEAAVNAVLGKIREEQGP
jgi:hypothetical protein